MMSSFRYTTTIEDILLSNFKNPNTGQPEGYGVDKNGDWLPHNVVIDQQFDYLFKDLHLNEYVTAEIKKMICQHYYLREIGFDTVERFKIKLESCLNYECYNLLKTYATVKDLSTDELNASVDLKTDTDSKSSSDALALAESKPDNRKRITIDDNLQASEYADALNEQHGKSDSEAQSHTHGWTGNSLANRLQEQAELDSILNQILIKLDKLFIQLW